MWSFDAKALMKRDLPSICDEIFDSNWNLEEPDHITNEIYDPNYVL